MHLGLRPHRNQVAMNGVPQGAVQKVLLESPSRVRLQIFFAKPSFHRRAKSRWEPAQRPGEDESNVGGGEHTSTLIRFRGRRRRKAQPRATRLGFNPKAIVHGLFLGVSQSQVAPRSITLIGLAYHYSPKITRKKEKRFMHISAVITHRRRGHRRAS